MQQSSVTFSVECSRTLPGQQVFVVGNNNALGDWKPPKAVPLYTTGEAFPLWSSQPLTMPPGVDLEYKFLVQQEDARGPVVWEPFPENRNLNTGEVPQPSTGTSPEEMVCTAVTSKSVWGNKEKNTITAFVSQVAPPPAARPEQTKQDKEKTFLKMAESGADHANADSIEASTLAKSFAERESLRRNFSQSLMCLDDEMPDDRHATPKAANEDVVVCQVPLDDEEDDGGDAPFMPSKRGISLHNISSFSALTQMMEPEEKAQARTGRKAHSEYDAFNLHVPVVIVSSEISPYSKSGGLGLVAASYSYEFARNGHPTMAIAPKYQHYEGLTRIGEHEVMVNERQEKVVYWHKYADYGEGRGCDYIFVDHPCIEREGGLYNGADGKEYTDNLFRFTLLSLAALEAPLILKPGGRIYGEKVLFLSNDWQAGLVPLYLSYKYRPNGCFRDARCIYVVHNLGYQGMYPHVNACKFFCITPQAANDLGFGNCVNLCKGALICADRVLTVSPNYAAEIQRPEGGFGLHDFVRAKVHAQRLEGILNGIDDNWNPETDTGIVRTFSEEDFEKGKATNKTHIQRTLGLAEDPNVVLIGFVGRLTWQKGVDVLAECIDWLMKDVGNGINGRAQLIMMGNGEAVYSDKLRAAEVAYKTRVCGYVGFDPQLEHQLMAGCDLFLMPSRYEPCGLPQMYSQQYGTLPIVTATGGLTDSVFDASQGAEAATGFHITHLSADKMKETLYRAMELYHRNRDAFKRMQRTAMNKDFYWPKAMDMYERQIDATLYDPPTSR